MLTAFSQARGAQDLDSSVLLITDVLEEKELAPSPVNAGESSQGAEPNSIVVRCSGRGGDLAQNVLFESFETHLLSLKMK